jgi:hypothetical protein
VREYTFKLIAQTSGFFELKHRLLCELKDVAAAVSKNAPTLDGGEISRGPTYFIEAPRVLPQNQHHCLSA